MFFRTLNTYLTLVFKFFSLYHKNKKVPEITENEGVVAGRNYSCMVAEKVLSAALGKTGAEIIVEGKENIPQDRNFVLIANHQSMLDVLAIYCTLGRPIGFVAKIELRKVPFLRNWMDYAGCLFMDRDDMRQSMKTILEGIKMVKEGSSLGIFPEGTRTDGPMLEFKGGSFKLATKSGAPILPLTIDGTHKILEDNGGWIKKATIKLTYHPIIETKGMPKDEQNGLSERVQGIIGSALKEEFRYGKDKNTDC